MTIMKQYGFTLLELLIVMTIVGIISAIAVPQYTNYKRRAFDMRAQSDLQSAALAEEAYFLDSEAYLSCKDDDCLQLPGLGAISNGVELKLTAKETSFTGEALNVKGTGKKYLWDSEKGGMQN